MDILLLLCKCTGRTNLLASVYGKKDYHHKLVDTKILSKYLASPTICFHNFIYSQRSYTLHYTNANFLGNEYLIFKNK